MAGSGRRVVTGHDAAGKSVVVSDGMPPQDHPLHGEAAGADFVTIDAGCLVSSSTSRMPRVSLCVRSAGW